MNTRTDPIEARLASLPITGAERREALACVAEGESIAELLISIANALKGASTLKPPYRDLHAQ